MVQDKLKEIEKKLKKIEKKVGKNVPPTEDLHISLKQGTDKILRILNKTLEKNLPSSQSKKKTPHYHAVKKSLEKSRKKK